MPRPPDPIDLDFYMREWRTGKLGTVAGTKLERDFNVPPGTITGQPREGLLPSRRPVPRDPVVLKPDPPAAPAPRQAAPPAAPIRQPQPAQQPQPTPSTWLDDIPDDVYRFGG